MPATLGVYDAPAPTVEPSRSQPNPSKENRLAEGCCESHEVHTGAAHRCGIPASAPPTMAGAAASAGGTSAPMRPTLPTPNSVNQRLPSDPATIPVGVLFAV